jgi:hypothetical protein
MTVPVSTRSVDLDEVQDAARARTACTAMYSPETLKVSNMISAVYLEIAGDGVAVVGWQWCQSIEGNSAVRMVPDRLWHDSNLVVKSGDEVESRFW